LIVPMKLLLDECLPRRLENSFAEYEISTVPKMGWAGIKNGQLLRIAQTEFDVLLTHDSSLQYQQELSNYQIAVIAFRAKSNRLEDLLPLVDDAKRALSDIGPGRIIIVTGAW